MLNIYLILIRNRSKLRKCVVDMSLDKLWCVWHSPRSRYLIRLGEFLLVHLNVLCQVQRIVEDAVIGDLSDVPWL